MKKIKEILSNKWFKFGYITVAYLLFILWLRNPWLILGLIVIYDMYISKKVNWTFWKPRNYKQSGKRSAVVEWVDAIVFAVIAASIIRIFFIEAYVIPSPSMEKTLLVGDYLFVSKTAYGPRVPNTPISFPFVHHSLPFTNNQTKSFLTWLQWPYKRLAGFGEVKRNDVVVFNFPEGDTVVLQNQEASYYRLVREQGRDFVWNNNDIIVRPVDKKENYIKRCVAVGGDYLQVKSGQLFINGKPSELFKGQQSTFIVRTNGTPINPSLFENLGIGQEDYQIIPEQSAYYINTTHENINKIKSVENVVFVSENLNTDYDQAQVDIFPHHKNFRWTEDNFGPLWVPKKGATLKLTPQNLPLYERVIAVYEKNKVEVKADSSIYINGKLANRYTFKMNYYFMMGDNRHNSADSRFWGFVPEDHVVGKASFIWFSVDGQKGIFGGIRWSRIFNGIH
jgi:signal peptidase I